MQPNFDLGCSPRCRNSIWPPSCDLQGASLCRINASEVSSYLHSSWKDQTDSRYQMQGEPRLCQPLVLRSGIQGRMSARAMRAPLAPASPVDRHLCLLGVEQFDTANALQPYTAVDHQLLTWVRPRQQSVSRDLKETVGSGATV